MSRNLCAKEGSSKQWSEIAFFWFVPISVIHRSLRNDDTYVSSNMRDCVGGIVEGKTRNMNILLCCMPSICYKLMPISGFFSSLIIVFMIILGIFQVKFWTKLDLSFILFLS